jgi:hypothetical protein
MTIFYWIAEWSDVINTLSLIALTIGIWRLGTSFKRVEERINIVEIEV